METETIDRLFLELSQVTSATTAKELRLTAALLKLVERFDEWERDMRQNPEMLKEWGGIRPTWAALHSARADSLQALRAAGVEFDVNLDGHISLRP